ncbi:MAG TPA: cytochrome c biogenesis protein CcdA [Rhodanobacteraceae bacterium]
MNVVEPVASRNPRLGPAIASGLALLVLGAGGYVAYLHAGALFASARTLPPVLLLALALIGGAASFFSPCSIAITPAFLAYLVSGKLPDTGGQPSPARLHRVAVEVAVGIVAFYAIAAAILALIGNIVYNFLIYLLPLVGVVFVALGGLLFFGRANWLSAVGRANPMNRLYERYETPAQNRGALSTLGFGFAYGATSHTCSLPIFLGILVVPLVAGNYALAAASILLYGAAIAALVIVMMLLGQQVFVAWRRQGARLMRLTALLFVATGGFLFFYFAQSYGAFAQATPLASLRSATARPAVTRQLVEGQGAYPYVPRTLTIPVDQPVRLAVTDHIGGCLLETVFDGLGPSGSDVAITVPVGATRDVTLRAPHPGRYAFHCSIGMYAGTVVAQLAIKGRTP